MHRWRFQYRSLSVFAEQGNSEWLIIIIGISKHFSSKNILSNENRFVAHCFGIKISALLILSRNKALSLFLDYFSFRILCFVLEEIVLIQGFLKEIDWKFNLYFWFRIVSMQKDCSRRCLSSRITNIQWNTRGNRVPWWPCKFTSWFDNII